MSVTLHLTWGLALEAFGAVSLLVVVLYVLYSAITILLYTGGMKNWWK